MGSVWGEGALRPPPALGLAIDRGRLAQRPELMGFRELRRLPGIGDGRAEAILQRRRSARSAAGALRWSDVSGIGERTEERIRAWLGDRGCADTEAFFRPYQGPARAPPAGER